MMKNHKVIAGVITLEQYERLQNALFTTKRYANVSSFVAAAVMDLLEKEEEHIKGGV